MEQIKEPAMHSRGTKILGLCFSLCVTLVVSVSCRSDRSDTGWMNQSFDFASEIPATTRDSATYIMQQSLQHTLAGGESLEPVSIEWERLDGVLKEGNQAAVVCGNVIGWLGHILQHGLLLKPVIAFPADHALVPLVPTKKEIKHQPDEWEKYQHKYPCQGLYRIAVVKDDNHDDSDNQGQIQYVEDGAGNLPQ